MNRLAIVTGAFGGMGAACVNRRVAEGWSMILCDIDPARVEALCSAERSGAHEHD